MSQSLAMNAFENEIVLITQKRYCLKQGTNLLIEENKTQVLNCSEIFTNRQIDCERLSY